MANLPDIIKNAKAHLRDVLGDAMSIIVRSNKKIVEKLDDLKPIEPIEPKDYTKDLNAIEKAVREQEVAENVTINNPEAITGDLKAGLEGIIQTLKDEVKNFEKEVVVKNDLGQLATLFKGSRDKKAVISALKDIENKIKMPDIEITDYTMILSDIATAIENDKAVPILKEILEKEVIFPSVMPVDLDPNLVEEDRVKVKLSPEQVSKMGAVIQGGNAGLQGKLIDQGNWLQQLGIDKANTSNYYFGFKLIGAEEWRIKRINKNTFAVDWATGKSDSDTAWAARTTQSYGNL